MATRFILTVDSARPISTTTGLDVDAQGRYFISFDATTDETIEWNGLVAPQGWTAPITAIVNYYMQSATSGSVRGEMIVEAIAAGDATDMDSGRSFDSTNSAGDSVPTTGQYPDSFTITLTNHDSSAAGENLAFRFNRDANGTTGTDDASGDMRLLSIEIRDSA